MTHSMTIESVADGFAAFGSPKRLAVFLELVRKGEEGCTITELQERCGIPASTLAHHLHHLTKAGVVTQERDVRSVICRANFARVDYLVTYLMKNCCEDAAGRGGDDAQAGCGERSGRGETQ